MELPPLNVNKFQASVDIIRYCEWPKIKKYMNKRIVRAVNECKTQATIAKKLVDKKKKALRRRCSSKPDLPQVPSASNTCYDLEDIDQVSWGSDFDDEEDDLNTCYLQRTLDGRHSSFSVDEISRCGVYDLDGRFDLDRKFASGELNVGKFARMHSPINHGRQTEANGNEFAGSSASSTVSSKMCKCCSSRASSCSSTSSSPGCANSTCHCCSAVDSDSGTSSGCGPSGCKSSTDHTSLGLSEQLKLQLNVQLRHALQQHSKMGSTINVPLKSVTEEKIQPLESTFRPNHVPHLHTSSASSESCSDSLQNHLTKIVNDYDCVSCDNDTNQPDCDLIQQLTQDSLALSSSSATSGSDKCSISEVESIASCNSSTQSTSTNRSTKPKVPPKPAKLLESMPSKNKLLNRPSNDPPPPPLPQSPPPHSPFGSTQSLHEERISRFTAEEVEQILNCSISALSPKKEQTDCDKPNLNKSESEPKVDNTDKLHPDYEQPIGGQPADCISPPPGFDDPPVENLTSCKQTEENQTNHVHTSQEKENATEDHNSTTPMSNSGSRPLYAVLPDPRLNGWRPLTGRLKSSSSMLQLPFQTDLSRPKLPKSRFDGSSHTTALSNPRFVVRNLPTRLKSLPEILSSRINLYGTENSTQGDESSLGSQSKNKSIINGQSVNTQGTEMALRPLPPLPLQHYSWFHDIEREEASAWLCNLKTEGAFLVRKSKRAGDCNPYSLTIYHSEKVFNLNIRKREDGLFALGKQKEKEKTFESIPMLIEYHQRESILLTTKGQNAGMTKLLFSPAKP